MAKSHTITNDIKVLRSGSTWSGAVVFGLIYAAIPWITKIELPLNLPPFLIFLPSIWIIQAIFGQFSTWELHYDLKRTDPYKTVWFYIALFIFIAFLISSFIFFQHLIWAICIVVGIVHMLLIRYLSPWVYKEPRSAHFQHDQQEHYEQVDSE